MNQPPLDPPWLRPGDPLATADDIVACFRLILGRLPSREEWTGHAAQAGQPLATVVASYLNSAEFAARGLLQNRPADDVRLVRLDGYALYVPTADEAVGRHVADGVYDPQIAAVLRQFLRPGMRVLDAGANIGVFALLAAALVGPTGAVLAMEPNPANARLLEASRFANGFAHLTVCQAAAVAHTGVLALHSFGSNGTIANTDQSALLVAQTVAGLPIDRLLDHVDLIKIDVEGAEHRALLGADALLRRCRPVIVSEFSPGLLAMVSGVDGPSYLRFLHGFGYRLGVIERDGGFKMGASVDAVMAAYAAAGVDHIDIIAAA